VVVTGRSDPAWSLPATGTNGEGERQDRKDGAKLDAISSDLTEMRRRDLLALIGTAVATMGAPRCARADTRGDMYGQIAQLTAVSGKRDELIAILLDGTTNLPGCLSYIVAKDAVNADAIWISEAWDNKESHQASLSLPSIKASIAKGRPLIAGFSNQLSPHQLEGQGLGCPIAGRVGDRILLRPGIDGRTLISIPPGLAATDLPRMAVLFKTPLGGTR
jgi:quinol monooxygenase YgiN